MQLALPESGHIVIKDNCVLNILAEFSGWNMY
jgi:hypothetical protein